MTPITPRERNRVFEYIQKLSEIEKPVEMLTKEVMLPIFDWPISQGKKRIKEIILGWEKLGDLQCLRDAHGALTVVSSTKQKIIKLPVVVVREIAEAVVEQAVVELP